MINDPTLIGFFNREPLQRVEADRQELQEVLVRALDPAATKLTRVKVLMESATEPSIHGLQSRLFDVLINEDFPLAVDILVDAAWRGAIVHPLLLRIIDLIDDPDQLRRVIGAIAANARDDLTLELCDGGDFAALTVFASITEPLQRLIDKKHRLWEIRELAPAILTEINKISGQDNVPTELFGQLQIHLSRLSALAIENPPRPDQNARCDTTRIQDPK